MNTPRFARLALCLCAALALTAPAHAQNIVKDPSFETPHESTKGYIEYQTGQPFGPWTVSAGNVDLCKGQWQPSDLKQNVDMNGTVPGTIYQDLATHPGQVYNLVFSLAANTAQVEIKSLSVFWDGVEVPGSPFMVNSAGRSNDNMKWMDVSVMGLEAANSLTRLQFQSNTAEASGPVIDNVRVTPAAAPSATLTDLGAVSGSRSVNGLNDSGQSTGQQSDSNGNLYAFILSNGTQTTLTTSQGKFISTGIDLNNSGQVTGNLATTDQYGVGYAYLYSNGQVTAFNFNDPEDYIGTPVPSAINASGQITGSVEYQYGNEAFIYYGPNNLAALGTFDGYHESSGANDINDSAHVTGSASSEGNGYAFVYRGNGLENLGLLGNDGYLGSDFSSGNGINNQDQVVGSSTIGAVDGNGDPTGQYHAFLWNNGTLTDLGTLGGMNSGANAINDSGQIVGNANLASGDTHACLWQNGTITDLNTLLGNGNSQWLLTDADRINASGQIFGYGTFSGATHAYLLTPQLPVTTASLSGTAGANGWFVASPVTVTLSATDPGGPGVASTHYSTDGGAYQPYSGPFTVSGDAAHTVMYYSTDTDGNSENPRLVAVKIDTVLPSTTAAVTTGYITLTATDATSGVAAIYNTLDGSTFAQYVGPIHIYGSHTLTFYSVDVAGNTEAVQSIHVSVPYPAPTLSSIHPASKPAGSPAFTLNVYGTGFTRQSVVKWNSTVLDTTFVSATQVSGHVRAVFITTAGTAQIKVTNPTPGGGVSSTATFTIIDATPPVTTAKLSGTAGTNGWFVASPVTVTLSATDTGGGSVAHTYYRIDGGSGQTYTAPFPVSGDGQHTVTFYSVDTNGNQEATEQVAVNIDTAPPTTTDSVTTGYVTLNATDTLSGIAATYNTLDGSAFAQYVGPIHIYGAHTLTFYSVDIAGNTESVKTAHVNVPYPLPTLSTLSPVSTLENGPAFTLTANGTGFSHQSIVKWDGSSLTTTFVSATQLTASVPNALLASPGTVTVTVVNPSPGGGISNGQTFAVLVTRINATVNSLSRNGSGAIVAHLTLQNAGYEDAPNVQVMAAQIGSSSTTTPLPLTVGTLAAGASAPATLTFPGSAGASGSIKNLTVSGTYTGGTWSKTVSISLP